MAKAIELEEPRSISRSMDKEQEINKSKGLKVEITRKKKLKRTNQQRREATKMIKTRNA